jgi:hypothetical protein
VVPRGRALGKPVFRELRDFTVNNESYRQMSIKKLGGEIEPSTQIVEPVVVSELSSAAGRKVVDEIPSASIGMFVDILGPKLPSAGTIRLQLQAGWGEPLESFDFEFELAKVPQQTPFSKHKMLN